MGDQPPDDLDTRPLPHLQKAEQEIKKKLEPVYNAEELARIAAFWKNVQNYNPRDIQDTGSYDLLDGSSKEKLDAAAQTVVSTILRLSTLSMAPTALKWFGHPPVYALSFALRPDYFPSILDAITANTDSRELPAKIRELVFVLTEFSIVVGELQNTTLNSYLVDQAIAYIPTHPISRICDVKNVGDGFLASAERDTEGKNLDQEA